jgi:hypothetical protein
MLHHAGMLKRLIASGSLLFMLYSAGYAKDSTIQAATKDAGIRRVVQELVLRDTGARVFGKSLDRLVQDLDTDRSSVPQNFLVKEMDLYAVVNKKTLTMQMYQRLADKDELLLETKVATGGMAMDHSTGKVRGFGTPSGKFYIKRIVYEPWWYPPEWAEEDKPSKPGPNNPYGMWMAELSTNSVPAGYGFGVPGDSSIRVHSTNKAWSIGTRSSHGCVRLHPAVAGELFPAMLHYTPHKEPKKNGRGTVYPLEKAIPVEIR